MGIVKKSRKKTDGTSTVEWIFVKRVPRRFQHVDPRPDRRVSLRTDSRSEAERKAPAVEAELIAYWEALAAGNSGDAERRFQAAQALAESRGVTYIPYNTLAAGPVDDLIQRLIMIGEAKTAAEPDAVIAAIAGGVPRPSIAMSGVLDDFFDLTTDRLAGKSEGQIKRWRLPRERAVRYFIEALGRDPDAFQITRDDALTYRQWWRARVEDEGKDAASANKDFSNISDVFGTWSELRGHHLENPFRGIRFRQNTARDSHPFSTPWISNTLLAPSALDALNAEAREPFLIMINTGARPSEIIDADLDDFVLDGDIPFLRVRARDGRMLKTDHSRRDIPLVGVSLDAARRFVALGGCPRYREKANGWSAAVNKYLKENSLRETPKHTAYSLRHAFEDRLLEAGVDERLRIELMGHKYHRPTYGRGGSLELKRDVVAKIAI